MSTTHYYLPEEIIFMVLALLPVKSLVRFSSVCKSWKSMISNTRFIQAHLNNSKEKRPSPVLIMISSENSDHADEVSVVYIDNRKDSFKIHLPPQDAYNICSCNGLVFFTNYHDDVLWMGNPSIRQFKILPAPNKRPFREHFCLGFGFDSVSNDYKILRIVSSDSYLEAELYSANADSWKEIQVPESLQIIMYNKCVCTNTGVLYLKGLYALVSFDLQDEVFGLHPYPVSAAARSDILDFEGSVALIFKSVDDNGSSYSLWMLNDICGELCWTKKFNLDADYEKYFALLYLGVGQYIAANTYGGYIYIEYIHGKKETKKFPSIGEVPSSIIGYTKYTESLISLEGFKQQE